MVPVGSAANRSFAAARCLSRLPNLSALCCSALRGQKPCARLDESDERMTFVELLGLAAALLTTLCWIPQGLKTIRTRETHSISLMTQSAFALGIVFWLVYGLLREDLPLILANSVSLVLVGTILIMKLRFG